MVTETIESKVYPADLSEYLKTQGAINTAMVARLSEPPVKVEASIDGKPVDATLEERKSWMPSFRVQGIDVLQVGLGYGVSVLATELVDGFLVVKTGATADEIRTNGYIRGGVKIAAGIASFMWGKRIFGETGKNVVALLVSYDGVRDIVPFDTWIKENLADRITGQNPAAGLTQGKPTRVSRNIQEQINQVAAGYYSSVAARQG